MFVRWNLHKWSTKLSWVFVIFFKAKVIQYEKDIRALKEVLTETNQALNETKEQDRKKKGGIRKTYGNIKVANI